MFESAARNLLENCAGLRTGQSLLILVEDSTTGFYDPGLAQELEEVAARMGIACLVEEVPFIPEARTPAPELVARMQTADRTLFLSRIGDQLRFSADMAGINPVVSYAIDRQMMASRFGQVHHRAMVALKDRINDALAGACHIRVTCPLGTDFQGPGAVFPAESADVTVARFPLSVFTPVPADRYSGRIAQAGFLTGTGSNYYAPYDQPLEDVLFVGFEGGRLTGFQGRIKDIAGAAAHYQRVGQQFGIEADRIHSWHAGIHPGCAYRRSAGEYTERWGGSAFGNPRILHFHTCGTEAPGEISINVIDPTIRLDGVAVWEDGRLHPDRVPGGAEILREFPCAAAAFAAPETEIGLDRHGRLSLVGQNLAQEEARAF